MNCFNLVAFSIILQKIFVALSDDVFESSPVIADLYQTPPQDILLTSGNNSVTTEELLLSKQVQHPTTKKLNDPNVGDEITDDDDTTAEVPTKPPNIEPAIVGGREAKTGEFPYMVSINLKRKHFCGGSIVTTVHVLTAAHCIMAGVVNEQAYLYSVSAGSLQHTSSQMHKVKQLIAHPAYYRLYHDVGLAVLREQFKWSTTVQPIELGKHTVPEGVPCLILGWGATKQILHDQEELTVSTSRGSQNLKVAGVSVYSPKQCYHKFLNTSTLYTTWICAAGRGTDACTGDSGGPLVYQSKVIGVTSFGKGCNNPKFPGVYANVSNYAEWIETAIVGSTPDTTAKSGVCNVKKSVWAGFIVLLHCLLSSY